MKTYFIICLVYCLSNTICNYVDCKKIGKDFDACVLLCSVLGGVIWPITFIWGFIEGLNEIKNGAQ